MSPSRTSNHSPIPILTYHQIDEAPAKGAPFRSLYVSPSAFSRQMGLLKILGYQGLSMSALQPYLSGNRTGKVVGITLDDGYLNNLTHALPVLERHGFSATCYVVSKREFEITQTVITDTAAKPHHSGFADMRTISQFSNGQAGKCTWVCQNQLANALLGGGQRRKRSLDSV